jgi:hypothetical protein
VRRFCVFRSSVAFPTPTAFGAEEPAIAWTLGAFVIRFDLANTTTVWVPDAAPPWKDMKKEALPLINFDALRGILETRSLGKYSTRWTLIVCLERTACFSEK